jgi:hypothetical protein
LDDKLAENLHLGTLAIQFENVAWGQLRGRHEGPYVASATIDSDGFCYDGVMDAHIADVVACGRFLHKPDVLFASLKTLDLA